jgi:peptidoglycan hydrolase CwlO-like protein
MADIQDKIAAVRRDIEAMKEKIKSTREEMNDTTCIRWFFKTTSNCNI